MYNAPTAPLLLVAALKFHRQSNCKTKADLRTISPDVHIVKGDYDESAFPLSITVMHNPIKIGVIHGHQCIPTGDLDSLSSLARQMDVDVLVSGHTHV